MFRHSFSAFVLLLAGLVVSGCASTPGKIQPAESVPPGELSRYTKISITITMSGDAASKVPKTDCERIATLVAQKIRELDPNRFRDFAATPNDPQTLHVVINLTRYDAGSAFARAMFAGLGQIHIDADVILEDGAQQKNLGRFKVSKSFAGGGIYGAATGIDDVQEGFAAAVAKAVLGQS
ncbi:DUF4410 domain-containing protein [Desulfosoma sp.]